MLDVFLRATFLLRQFANCRNNNLHHRKEYVCSLQELLDKIIWLALGSRSDWMTSEVSSGPKT